MSALALCFLGDLKVVRGADSQNLPPSKKTRALLAYLALNRRAFRREVLCELLWEIPDDPRGSLRWSLSKLRKLVDDDIHQRIVADRHQVAFDASDTHIDCQQLHALVSPGIEDIDTERLVHAASQYMGGFLEGLELDKFHDFYLWCMTEREKIRQSQAALLTELCKRLCPEDALPYARMLVSLKPDELPTHAQLIALLVKANYGQQAEQQYQQAKRVLAGYGIEDTTDLYRALLQKPEWPSAKPSTKPPADGAVPQSLNSAASQASTSFCPESVNSTASQPSTNLVAPAVAAGEAKLIGRDQELETLTTHYREVCQHSTARLLLIRGEPGMGKSSLLQTTLRNLQKTQAWILHADAFESEIIRPFALWHDAFRRSAAKLAPEVLSGEDRISRNQIFAGLSGVITRQTNQQPVVIIFDDLQWSDESSVAALHYVLRMNRRSPLFALVAARDAELQSNRAALQAIHGLRNDGLLQDLPLRPLSSQNLQQLICLQAPEADAEKLSEECQGNPLLAIELARSEAAGDSHSEHGHSLHELIKERMTRMNDQAKELLHWAAVLDPHIALNTLTKVTQLSAEQLEKAIVDSEQQGILRVTERGFQFYHNLISRSVYQQLPASRCQLMHRRVAELLEIDTALDLKIAADLAHHASKSGDQALAARAMVSAGRLCLRFFANEDAFALSEKGIALAQSLNDSERICITLELLDIQWKAAPVKDWQAAADFAVDLAEQALDHGDLSHARFGYQIASELRWLNGQWLDAQQDSLQAERVARGGTDEDHILGMAEAAKCFALLERNLTQADAMILEARSLASRKNIPSAAIPLASGMLCYYRSEFEQANEHLQEARTLYKSMGDRVNEYQANEYLVMMEIEQGRYDRAERHCRQLLRIGGKLKEGSECPFARAVQALCQYALSDKNEALAGTLHDLRVCDAKHRLAYILIRAGLLDAARGRNESAITRGTEGLRYAELMHRPSEKLLAHIVLAQAKKQGNIREFIAHMEQIRHLNNVAAAVWARHRADEVLDRTNNKAGETNDSYSR
jgi:DNA-binding SARP family transcriptional activator